MDYDPPGSSIRNPHVAREIITALQLHIDESFRPSLILFRLPSMVWTSLMVKTASMTVSIMTWPHLETQDNSIQYSGILSLKFCNPSPGNQFLQSAIWLTGESTDICFLRSFQGTMLRFGTVRLTSEFQDTVVEPLNLTRMITTTKSKWSKTGPHN